MPVSVRLMINNILFIILEKISFYPVGRNIGRTDSRFIECKFRLFHFQGLKSFLITFLFLPCFRFGININSGINSTSFLPLTSVDVEIDLIAFSICFLSNSHTTQF